MFSLNEKAILGSYLDNTSPKVPVMASSSIMSGAGGSGGGGGFNAGGTFIQHDLSYHLLDGFVNYRSQGTLYKMYREIYTMDAITGPAIDQISSLPWSSYSLLGIQDKQIMDIYSTSLSELNIIRLLTYMSTTYLVLGTVIGSLIFDKDRGIFSDCILYNPDDCELIPIPMIGYDPKVNVKVSKEMIAFLNSTDFRDLEAKKELSSELEAQLRSGKSIMLEPLSTLVISRDMLPGVTNLSYLSRILPIWIVEKALTRGTIQASLERQRGVLHIQCLHSDTQLYVNGQLKPIGKIVSEVDQESSTQQVFDVDFYTRGLDDKAVRVYQLIYQGKKKIFQLATFNGLKIKCTQDHKFACLDAENRVYYKELMRLTESDRIITIKGLSHPSRIRDLGYMDSVYDISIDTSTGDRPVFSANGLYVHNCLEGSSLIDKDGALVRIDSICDSREVGKPVDVDFTTVGFNGKRVRVYRWIYQGKQDVYEITTKSGYSIQATADHKFVTLKDNELKYTFKTVSELKKGDPLMIGDKNERVKGKKREYKFKLDKKSINEGHFNRKQIKIPEYMTPELAYIIGMLLSDGELSDIGVYIVGNELEQLKILGQYINKIFNITTRITKKANKGTKEKINNVPTRISKNVYTLTINSLSLVEFFKQIGIKTSSQLNKIIRKKHIKPSKHATYAKPGYAKTIPFSIFEADRNSQLAFLAGYIDGDGNVLDRKDKNDFSIRICSYSNEMLKQLQILLAHLGTKSTISWPEHSIKLCSYNIETLHEEIKHYMLIKHKKINNYGKWTKQGSWLIGLPTANVIAEINARYVGKGPHRQFVFRNDEGEEKIVKNWGRICTSNIMRTSGATKSFKYHQYKIGSFDKLFDKISEISEKLGKRLHRFMDAEVIFDEIISIRKKGIKDVYDISIDTSNGDAPIFVANGCATKNCGSDDFEYTTEQQQALANLVQNTSRDPQGAVIVTRPDVNISEFRQGTDFWSISNERDSFTNIKLRALGLSESFGADTNYSSGENSITIFLEHMRAFRENFTRAVVYDKVFLLLAKYHGFRKRANVEIDHNIRYDVNSNKAAKDAKWSKYAEVTGSRNLAEAANFHIPEIRWTKELQARGDSNALSLLQTAKDLGMPLPIGLVSTFAGIPLANLLDNLNEDIEARKKIKEYQDEIKKINPASEEDGDDGGGMFGSVAEEVNGDTSQSPTTAAQQPTHVNRALLAKLRHTGLNSPRQLAKIKDKTTLMAYLEENIPPEVKITAKQARQILRQANSIKPGLVKF